MIGVTCLFVYLALYLGYVKKIGQEQWETYCPWAIPTMTVTGLLTGLFFMIGMWPVWGVITPVILFVLFMGFMMPWYVISLLPSAFRFLMLVCSAHLVPNF
jgi:hypothetical protein